jgi:hypothetical protein
LAETLAGLRAQDLPADKYEIVVVDDGSTPPVTLPDRGTGPHLGLIRLGGGERSAARNFGAAAARGDLLVFVDDDLSVAPAFLTEFLKAHAEWPDAILVGRTVLPEDARRTPFGRFRHRLEQDGVPLARGLVAARNFCAAGNMAIGRQRFLDLGGFDRGIVSSEDQDLALRHTAASGRIAYVPEADAVHRDGALDVRSYCRRHEWGTEQMLPFCRRYPDWPDNVARERVNGRAGPADGFRGRWRKRLKAVLATRPATGCLLITCDMLERLTPGSGLLDRLYRLVLGAHIFRGYQKGVARLDRAGPRPLEAVNR